MNRIVKILIMLSMTYALPALAHGPSLRAGAGPFGLNDVSLLFPQKKDGTTELYPHLPLTAIGLNQKPLLSRELFGEIVTKFQTVTEGSLHGSFSAPNYEPNEIDLFQVVNFRYDPCFPKSAAEPLGCIQQIRLVVQPAQMFEHPFFHSRSAMFDDYSIHLLYQVGLGFPKPDDPVIKDLLQLKRLMDQSARPEAPRVLTISPALANEWKRTRHHRSGPVAKALVQLILKHVSEANLQEVTVVNGDDSDTQGGLWNFVGGTIQGGHWDIQPIPRLGTGMVRQITDMFGTILNESGLVKMPSPSIAEDADIDRLKVGMPEASVRLRDLEALLNPRVTNPRNTDCASCHMAPASKDRLLKQVKGLNPAPSLADPRFAQRSFANVHVIGYLHEDPVVTALVANSAAHVAQQLNDLLKK